MSPIIVDASIEIRTSVPTSSDHALSTGQPNPDPNPQGLRPAPGPSYIEYPGVVQGT